MIQTLSRFRVDDAWTKQKRDRYLKAFYGGRAVEGRYVFIDKSRCSSLIQQRFEVDTIFQVEDGKSICVEEKIVRWKGKNLYRFFLETESCTNEGHESPGWMHYGEADFLLYAFELKDGSLDVYTMNFQKLKTWFWSVDHSNYHSITMEEDNRTKGLLVPIVDVVEAVPTKRFHVQDDGTCVARRINISVSLFTGMRRVTDER
jgi:hypothetical protein